MTKFQTAVAMVVFAATLPALAGTVMTAAAPKQKAAPAGRIDPDRHDR